MRGWRLCIDRQGLCLQILIDLVQILIDPAQLPFERIQLGLAGDADTNIGVVIRHPAST